MSYLNILNNKGNFKYKFLTFLTILLISFFQNSLCQYDLQDYGIIIDNQQKAKYHWGTYKPNLYFALKNRRNTS